MPGQPSNKSSMIAAMIRTFIIAVMIGAFCLTASAQERIVIEDFQSSRPEHFPSGWRNFPFQGGKVKEVYRVQKEGTNRYLSAHDEKHYSIQTFKKIYWDLDDYPQFSWKWRAKKLPERAGEGNGATNDSACGIYIIFSQIRQEAIKFVWSSTLSVGTIKQKPGKKMFFSVQDSGGAKVGQWVKHTVNLKEAYEKLFHEKPQPVVGIGILTDGNAVQKAAACDYDDFLKLK